MVQKVIIVAMNKILNYLSRVVFSVQTRHLKRVRSHCHFCPVHLRKSPHKLLSYLRIIVIGMGLSRTWLAQAASSINVIVAHHQRTWLRLGIAPCQGGADAVKVRIAQVYQQTQVSLNSILLYTLIAAGKERAAVPRTIVRNLHTT